MIPWYAHLMGQHLFWGNQLGGTSLRAVPLNPRGQFIGHAGPFMGQQTLSVASLSSLSIKAIQNRVLATPPLLRLKALLANIPRGGGFGRHAPLPPPFGGTGLSPAITIPEIPWLTDAEANLIGVIAADPSSEDLDDLRLIDGFFGIVPGGNQYQSERALTRSLCDIMNGKANATPYRGGGTLSTAQAIYAWLNYKPPGRAWYGSTLTNASADELEAIRSNPFFCGRPTEFPEVVYGLDKANYAGWFDIDPNQAWGTVKQQVQNAITVMNVVGSYPFPPPLDLKDDAAFWILSISDIREIVHTPVQVDPEAVRYWITMTILANYVAWSDRIAEDAKKKAKKAKRKMIMTVVALAVASIVAAFLLPAVIALAASAIQTAVTTYVDAQKRRKAAQEMANASKMFADDAPAFSKEVDHAAAMLDEQAAAQEAALKPSPEVQAAIDEVKAETGPAWGTILPVGGGIAAAGLVALAIFK